MGPKPRDYTYRPPRTVRRGAIASALSLRVGEKALLIVKDFPSDGKTKATAATLMKGLKLSDALVVDAKANVGLRRAVQNMRRFDVIPPEGINVESILRRKTLVLTVAAANALNKALQKTKIQKAQGGES